MNHSRGVTLVELLLLIIVIGTLLGGITLFLAEGTLAAVSSKDTLIARNLARLAMAETSLIPALFNEQGEPVPWDIPPPEIEPLPQDPDFLGYKVQRKITGTVGHINGHGKFLTIFEIRVAKISGSFSNPLVILTTYRDPRTLPGDGVYP